MFLNKDYASETVCFLWTLYIINLLSKLPTNGPGNNFAHMPEASQLTLKGK
jgi:hypothetical protein